LRISHHILPSVKAEGGHADVECTKSVVGPGDAKYRSSIVNLDLRARRRKNHNDDEDTV
jgi:hypothetical protein